MNGRTEFTGLLGEKYEMIREKFLHDISPEVHAQTYVGLHDKAYAEPEFSGKYIDLCTQFYRDMPGSPFLDYAARVVASVLENQKEDGDVSALESYDSWFPVWNQVFTIFGLLSYYDVTREAKVLSAAEKCADGIMAHFKGEKIAHYLDTVNDGSEHLCFLLPLSMLYALTGKEKYRDFAEYLLCYLEKTDMNLVSFTDILKLRSKKGIEMLLAYLGLAHFGRVTGNAAYLSAADRYFRQVNDTQIRNTGNGTLYECWREGGNAPVMLPNEEKPNETCVAVGFSELALALFEQEPDGAYLDAVEKSLFNHILGALSNDGKDFGYYQGNFGVKVTETREGQYQCCRYRASDFFAHMPEILYYEKDRVVIPRIYTPSVYRNGDITLIEKTDYPKNGEITFEMTAQNPFVLRLRIPSWCKAYLLRVNGETKRPLRKTELEGQKGLLTLRIPAGKTRVDLTLCMDFVTEEGEIDGKKVVSFRYGPLLLVEDSRVSDMAAVYRGAPVSLLPGDGQELILAKAGDVVLVDYASAARVHPGVDTFLTWIPAEGKRKKLVCIGDSLTEGDYGEIRGVGCVQPENYPFFLSRMLGCETVNYGKCGYTTAQILAMYERGEIDLTGADGVILTLGTNAGLTLDGDALLTAYRKLIGYCVEQCGKEKVILCTPPHATELPGKLNSGYFAGARNAAELVPGLAEEFGTGLIDLYHAPELGEAHEEEMQPNDGLHFAAYGYRTLASVLAREIPKILPDFKG